MSGCRTGKTGDSSGNLPDEPEIQPGYFDFIIYIIFH